MQTPVSVISYLHRPIMRFMVQTVMPFIMTQHDTMPPVSIVQRFCTMLAATLSSQMQWILMPPGHFSIL